MRPSLPPHECADAQGSFRELRGMTRGDRRLRTCPRGNQPDLRNLQAYIYKRPGDASATQVFNHVEAVDVKDRLTAGTEMPLLIPACSHPDAEVIRWLVEHGSRPQKQLKKLMTMTVGWNERRLWPRSRLRCSKSSSISCLRAMKRSCLKHFQLLVGLATPVPKAWLIERGADSHYESWSALARAKVDCLGNAKMRGTDSVTTGRPTSSFGRGTTVANRWAIGSCFTGKPPRPWNGRSSAKSDHAGCGMSGSRLSINSWPAG